MRKVIGAVVLAAGLTILLMDAHVAYINETAAHGLNIGTGLFLIYLAVRLLMPAAAEAFAKELLQVIPTLGVLWPGGRRSYDPAPQPGVPLPPSVREGE